MVEHLKDRTKKLAIGFVLTVFQKLASSSTHSINDDKVSDTTIALLQFERWALNISRWRFSKTKNRSTEKCWLDSATYVKNSFPACPQTKTGLAATSRTFSQKKRNRDPLG